MNSTTNNVILREFYIPKTNSQQTVVETKDYTTPDGKTGKHFYLEGLFIQGNVKNHNGRIYPAEIIKQAVDSIQKRIEGGETVLGEADHPDSLQINIDRVSHQIEKMWVKGNDGWGKLRVLPSVPCGAIVEGLLKENIKLGVSSRGAGHVNEYTSMVEEYDIVTVDIVVQPSAPDAYPTAIYESIFGSKVGRQTYDVYESAVSGNDAAAQKYLEKELKRFIESLKIR